MSFFETLIDGSNEKERKQKKLCAIVILVTAVLLAIALIVFTICQVVDATSNNNSDKEKDTEEETVNLGETTVKTLSDTAIYSGNLLTLDSSHRYKGDVDVVNLQQRTDRPKTEANENTYSVLSAVRDKYHATEETAKALNKMLKAFYEAKKDDNLFISGAYDTSKIDDQDAIYSSGETIALSYFHDYATNGINDQRTIAGVDTYKWIYANAHKYGFVAVSSNSNEFRYIGVTHATAMKSKGLSLNNYLKQLKNATPDSPMQLDASGSHIAYYCPIDDVKIPKNYSYEISGNNVDGVIITVNLSKASANIED
jgi:D-alanyl-D-alanine carboxypeptidase